MTPERQEAFNRATERPHEASCSVCGHDLGIGTPAELAAVLVIHARWKPRHEGAKLFGLQPTTARDHYLERQRAVSEVAL